jgi:hypothetical protein
LRYIRIRQETCILSGYIRRRILITNVPKLDNKCTLAPNKGSCYFSRACMRNRHTYGADGKKYQFKGSADPPDRHGITTPVSAPSRRELSRGRCLHPYLCVCSRVPLRILSGWRATGCGGAGLARSKGAWWDSVRFAGQLLPVSSASSQVKSILRNNRQPYGSLERKPIECAPEASRGGRESLT